MSTFAELRASLSRRLGDPDLKTFTADDLSDMINEGVAEVSRLAPQPFLEDVPFVTGRTRYRLRGGNATLVANGSFEEGDDTVRSTAPVLVAVADAPSLLQGWSLVADTPVYFPRNAARVTGTRIGILVPTAGQVDATAYADIPVNPGVTYQVEGYHGKGLTGGLPARLELETRDSDNDLVDSVWTHDTTAGTLVLASTSYDVPDDGSVAYLRIKLVALGTQPTVRQAFCFEDISVAESSQAVLVASNATNAIEISRVEIWQSVGGVPRPISEVWRPGISRSQFSEVGWRIWGGVLEVPFRIVNGMAEGQFLRVWGYAPYDTLASDTQVTDLTAELEWAVLEFCDMLAVRRLLSDRNLFTQWQTRSNNTDITPAGLANRAVTSEQLWERRKRGLYVLRA